MRYAFEKFELENSSIWTSSEIEVEPFDELITSWNALTPGQSWLKVEARVRLASGWTGWYSFGRWGTSIERGCVPNQSDEAISLAVDTLKCQRGQATAWQARLTLAPDPTIGDTPTLVDLVILSHISGSRQPFSQEPHPAWGNTLDVPQRSQAVEAEDIRWHICSPTSVGMALAYHGVDQTTVQVCAGVFDYGEGIWGNWPLNAAYVLPASAGRLVGHVARWDTFRPLEDEIAAGRPVVLSHRWREGDLEGATSPHSNGHLIVVVGFTAEGDVVVNDPAADPTRGASIRRVYRRSDIYRTWLERAAGVVYTLRPAKLS